MHYKAYIFDLDGTVLDSMGVWKNIDIRFLGKRGLTFTPEYAKAISSMKLDIAAEYTIKLYGLMENPRDIIDEWLEMAKEEFAFRVGLKSYARELLETLSKNGIQTAVATTSTKELYVPALKRNGIYEYFDAFADSDTVSKGKDSPEIFLRAAELLNRKPSECIVFEDTAAGLRSAKSAGFTAAAVIGEETDNAEEIKALADFVSCDFEKFYREAEEIGACTL